MYVQAHLLYWLTTLSKICYQAPLDTLYTDYLSESLLQTPLLDHLLVIY